MEKVMKEEILIKNSYQKLIKKGHTMFLDEKERKRLEIELHYQSIDYSIFQLFEDCDKVIFYRETLPEIVLLEITSIEPLEHRKLLGSLFSFGIEAHTFGDIIVLGQKSYVIVFPTIAPLLQYQLTKVGKIPVSVKPVPISTIESYKRQYQDIKIKVPSLRIDAVLSKITHLSRSQIIEKIKQKEVLLNYEIVTKPTKEIKENNVFSIRKYGKYRFIQVMEMTKKQEFWISIKKYQ